MVYAKDDKFPTMNGMECWRDPREETIVIFITAPHSEFVDRWRDMFPYLHHWLFNGGRCFVDGVFLFVKMF